MCWSADQWKQIPLIPPWTLFIDQVNISCLNAFFLDSWFPCFPPCLWTMGDYHWGVPQRCWQVHGCPQVNLLLETFLSILPNQPLRPWIWPLPLSRESAVWSPWRGVWRGTKPTWRLSEGTLHQCNWNRDNSSRKDGGGSLLCPFWDHGLWGCRNCTVCHALVFAAYQGDPLLKDI